MVTDKPWGWEEEIIENYDGKDPITIKILFIKAGEMTSMQYHKNRDEKIKVLSGMVKVDVMIDDKTTSEKLLIDKNIEMLITRMTRHRLEAVEDSKILEIIYGHYNPNDIIRISDKYGRVKNTNELQDDIPFRMYE